MAEAVKPRIVEAVGTATSTASNLARRIEAAMHEAATKAFEAGNHDAAEVLALKLAARDRVKAAAASEQLTADE